MENMSSKSEQKSITGKEAFRFEQGQEDAITVLTEALLDSGQLGNNAPKVYERLAELLFYLLQIATCQWGCKQGDHIVENLVRRFYNSACAALRLMMSGLYDEALGSVRVTAELANLLQAFEKDRNYLDQWKASSLKQRQKKFSPVKVRCFIERHGIKPVVNEEEYSKLCEYAIHVSPTSLYLSHDLLATLHAGGYFSMPGVFLILNTLAWIVGPCLLSAAHLIQTSEEKYQILRNNTIDLLYVAQGLKIDRYEEELQKLRSDYHHQLVLKEMDAMDEQKWEELSAQLEQELEERGEQNKLNTMSEKEIMDEFGAWAYHKISQRLHRKLQKKHLQQTIEASQIDTISEVV